MDKISIDDYFELLSPYTNKELIEECFNSILHNDKAHDVYHVYFVTRRAIRMAIELFPHNLRLHTNVALAALMHDLGCRYDRANHHFIGANMANEMMGRYGYSEEDCKDVRQAVVTHRASYKGDRETVTQIIVAVADRGPFNLKEYINRCISFRLEGMKDGLELTRDNVIKSIIDHMQHKFGKDGYCWKTYPELGMRFYSENITKFKSDVENTDLMTQLIIDDLPNHQLPQGF